jgi:hypothetical protein
MPCLDLTLSPASQDPAGLDAQGKASRRDNASPAVKQAKRKVTIRERRPFAMSSSFPSGSATASGQGKSHSWYEAAAAAQIHAEQLQRVERLNGRAAMLGFAIDVLIEALTGQGILHQIGLGTLLSQG